MKKLTSIIVGAATLFSSLATDLYGENRFNLPNFERMNLRIETEKENIKRRTYPKKFEMQNDGTAIEAPGYITFSINCFGEERVMFYYDFFSKKSFERDSFFGDFRRLPSNAIPNYRKMTCAGKLT